MCLVWYTFKFKNIHKLHILFFKKFRVPTRTGKPRKWEDIFQSGKSQGIFNGLEKAGKIKQNTGKLKEFQTNVIYNF